MNAIVYVSDNNSNNMIFLGLYTFYCSSIHDQQPSMDISVARFARAAIMAMSS